jgi:hypothetical protein
VCHTEDEADGSAADALAVRILPERDGAQRRERPLPEVQRQMGDADAEEREKARRAAHPPAHWGCNPDTM